MCDEKRHMGSNTSFLYYVIVAITIFNVLSLLIWFSITNVIRLTSGISVSSTTSSSTLYDELTGTGSINSGIITFTTGDDIPPNSELPITITFPYIPPGSFVVAVIGITAGGSNASSLPFNVTDTTSNSFTFVNGFPLSPNTEYVVSYVTAFP